jgi:predicted Ser/Thr protein kinase
METKRICPSCQKTLPTDIPLGLCPECLIRSGFKTGIDPRAAGDFAPPPVAELAGLFPQLEILGLTGHGGMGAVYKARQPALDRLVALKILAPRAAGDAGFAERFNREARALARLNHPNIVAVHDFGRARGLHYLLMEFVDGPNLRQVQQAGRLAPEQALQIVPQICDALQFAHRAGIVHRDIKPENILLDKSGHVKITDFGIAKILTENKANLTGARDVVGTPHYMAPEQVEKPQLVDHRADIYSLGVVFYEMLTGELPLGKFAPPSRKVQVDVRLDEVVLRALEKEPEQRYQHATEVKTDVETIATSASAPICPSAEVWRQVRWPAFGLIATGGFNLATAMLVTLLVALSAWAVNSSFDLEGVMNLFPEWFYDPAHRKARLILAIGLIVCAGLGSLTILGGLKMLRLQARPLAMAAAISAMWVSPGAYLGLPIGVWAIVVMTRQNIRQAFHRSGFRFGQLACWTLISITPPFLVSLSIMLSSGGSRASAAAAAAELRARQMEAPATIRPPPVVIATVPESGSSGVDPSLKELRVTFSRPMQNGGWSWSSLANANSPKVTGTPRYLDDARTCVLPVRLEPGKVYALWLNSDRYRNFADSNGLSAIPYLLTFETRKE